MTQDNTEEQQELDDELREKIDEEITRAYIAGLFDSKGLIGATVKKDATYAFGYSIQPEVRLGQNKPYSIQLLDEWATENNIFGNVRKTDGRYEFKLTKGSQIERFIELLMPYSYNQFEAMELMREEILPLYVDGSYRDSKEQFVELVEYVDEVRELNPRSRSPKYTVGWFEDEWNL